MKSCLHCQAQIEDNSIICPYCGKGQIYTVDHVIAETRDEIPVSDKIWATLSYLNALCFCIAAVAFLARIGNKQHDTEFLLSHISQGLPLVIFGTLFSAPVSIVLIFARFNPGFLALSLFFLPFLLFFLVFQIIGIVKVWTDQKYIPLFSVFAK